MKLGFDVDGLTADMAKVLVEFINEKYDLNHDLSVLEYHRLDKNTYVDDPQLNTEIVKAMKKEVIRNPDVVANLPVHEEAIEAIRKLSRHGHTIHHITARSDLVRAATTAWLRKNHIPFTTVHVVGNGGKGKIGRSLNLDFFMDDAYFNLYDMYRYKKRWRKGLAIWTRPWNENEPGDIFINRFDKWNAVIRHLGINKR